MRDIKKTKKRKKSYVDVDPEDNGLSESHQIIKSLIANKDASHEELSNALDSLNKEPESELTSSLRDAIHSEIKRRHGELESQAARMKAAIEEKKAAAAKKKKDFEDDLESKVKRSKEGDKSSSSFNELGYNTLSRHYKDDFNYHRLGKLQKAVDRVQWKTTDEGKKAEAAKLGSEIDHLHPHFSKEYRMATKFNSAPEQIEDAKHAFPFLKDKTPSAIKSHFEKVKKSVYHQFAHEEHQKQEAKRKESFRNSRILNIRPTTINILSKRAEERAPLGRKLFSFIKGKVKGIKEDTMTEEANKGNPYFLHVLYGKKGEKGDDDYKTEILKINNPDAQNHPDQKEIHKSIQSHPISKLHAGNGYNYMYAIGSPHDSPVRSNELMSLLQKNNKDKSHMTKVWESVAHELTEESILATHKRLANRK